MHDLMVKHQSSHVADYHGAVFRKLHDGRGGALKHLREFSGITWYRADTLTAQKLYHLCNSSKIIQETSTKVTF